MPSRPRGKLLVGTINGVNYMDKKHNENMKRMEDNKPKEDKKHNVDKKLTKDNKHNEENNLTEDKKHIEQKKNIEIWEDLVQIKDLLIALLICVSTTFFGYFIAPGGPPKPLFFGLIGAIIGFIITSIIINPKREFAEGDGEG